MVCTHPAQAQVLQSHHAVKHVMERQIGHGHLITLLHSRQNLVLLQDNSSIRCVVCEADFVLLHSSIRLHEVHQACQLYAC